MRLSATLSAEGLTLDEMAGVVHASRRSAERMRDAVEAAFGTLDRIEDGQKIRFRLAARSLGNFAAAPTAEELTEFENAARAVDAGGVPGRAASLRSLRHKIGERALRLNEQPGKTRCCATSSAKSPASEALTPRTPLVYLSQCTPSRLSLRSGRPESTLVRIATAGASTVGDRLPKPRA
jgi:predicted DNA-binding transcriptional regulator YafY